MVNDIAVQEFVNAIKETPQDTNKTYNATVSRVDDEGVVWVNIHGSEKETPTASTSTEVKRGDAVTVNWRNNKLYIGGNYSNPSAGVVRVASVEQNAEDARLAAEAAEYNARLAQSLAEQNAITMANTVIEINSDIADLQNQIDGNITTWFYDYQPTTSNAPASTWTTVDEKNNHLGDLFYDTSTGYAYRWMSNGASTPTFSWSKITDTDVTTALATALAAQDTADHKRRVFITTPTVPYDVGDLWCEGTTGDILTCTHARTEAQSYSASDWSKLNKYTDDTRADEAYTLANTAKVSADGKNKIYRQATQPSDGTYVVGDIWFDTSHSNKIYRYSGSAWVAVTLGDDALDSLSANKLTAGTIDASIITVSNLDAGNITTGNLAADRMKVNSISAINSNTGTVKIAASKVEIDGTATFNAIKPSADATYDAIGAASTAVDSLQIGGRNLLQNSMMRASYTADGITITQRASAKEWVDISGTATALVDQWVANLQSLTVTNATVTISANSVFSDSANNYFYVSTSKNGAWYKDYKQITWYSSTERRLTINLENGETLRYIRLHLVNGTTISGGYRFKVELGNKQTDWAPAPEDVQAEIDAKKSVHTLTSSITAGRPYATILGYAAEGTVTTFSVVTATGVKVGDTVRLAYLANDMGTGGTTVYIVGEVTAVNPNSVTLKAHGLDTTVIDGGHILTGTIDANKVNVSNLTVGSAQSGWNDVLNSEIEVGGRNLIRALDETKMPVTKSGCSYTYDNGKYTIECTTAGGGSTFAQIYSLNNANALSFNNVSPGDTVIFHVDSVVSSNSALDPRIYLDLRKADGTNVASKGIYQSLNGWVSEFEIPAEVAKYTLIIRLDQNKNAAVGDTLTVSGIKLEKGNKATDWTPAPEDVQSEIVLSGTNMLTDWDASSLAFKDAKSARYWAGAQSYFNYSFFSISDPPENNIHNGVRCALTTAQTAEVQTGYAFYAAETNDVLPLSAGNSYTISCWARCTAGSGRVKIYYRENTTATGVTPVTALNSTWKRVYGVFTPSVVSFGRVWFYVNFPANTTGTVEMCGFKCVANGDSAEATSYITSIDSNGIRIHPSSTQNNSAVINANGLEIFKGGTTSAYSVASYGDTARIGKTSANNVQIDTNGLNLYSGTTRVCTLQQKQNYTPSYTSQTYSNACFINLAEYLAFYIKTTPSYGSNDPFPVLEMNGTEANFTLGEGFINFGDWYDSTDGTYDAGGVGISVQNPSAAERTSQQTCFEAVTEDADTWFGVGRDGGTCGIYSEDLGVYIIGMDVRTGVVRSAQVYEKTTSGGSNVRVETSGYGYLRRYVSSSRRYKDEIEDITDETLDPNRLYDARVVQFKYKDDYLDKDDQRYGKLVNGFIAEELDEIYPIAVNYEDEKPEDWEPKFIIPPMLKLIQDQKKKIDELEARVEALERK